MVEHPLRDVTRQCHHSGVRRAILRKFSDCLVPETVEAETLQARGLRQIAMLCG